MVGVTLTAAEAVAVEAAAEEEAAETTASLSLLPAEIL